MSEVGAAAGDAESAGNAEPAAAGGGTHARSRARRLSIRGLNKWFGANHVVKDLSLAVEPSEFLVLLGPSGCGKTTALRIIAGLEAADSGRVLLGDTDVTDELPKYRDIAMVFQSYALYPHKTVAENIGFPLKVRGLKGEERAAAVRDAAAQVHMEDLLERYPRQLSGGQRQRVALARAIVRRPSAFLMDEPLSNLDAKLRGYMRAGAQAHAARAGGHHGLRDPRPGGGDDPRPPGRDPRRGRPAADRHPARGVRQPREPVRRRLHGLAADELRPRPHRERPVRERRRRRGRRPVEGARDGAEAVMGFRPEDAEVADPGTGLFDATVYAAELTGDVTLVTVALGEDASLSIKMPKEYDVDFDRKVAVRFPLERGFLFDAATGDRLPARFISAPPADRADPHPVGSHGIRRSGPEGR